MSKIILPNRFVGLHAHSGAGSPYDGLGYPSQHIDFVLSNGMNAWCLTDHGNGNGLAHAHTHAKKLKKKGINYRQLYGVEFYFVPSLLDWRNQYEAHREAVKEAKKLKKKMLITDIDSDDEISGGLVIEDEEETKSEQADKDMWKRRYHLVVFAKNRKGLSNLFTLVKKSYTDGFYRFPRIDFDLLKLHSEGLVVSTACVGGYPASLAIRGEATGKSFNQIQLDLENMTDRFVDAVGRDNFNLEIQFNSLGVQHTLNKHLLHLSKSTGIPLVATADSHYYSRDAWEARELYKKLGRMGARGSKMAQLPKFEDLKCELYPKNAGQMWEEYLQHKYQYDFYEGQDQVICDAIERTYDIAWDQCETVWFDEDAKLPTFATPEKTSFQQLAGIVKDRLKFEGLHDKKEYVDRAAMELSDIKHLGFADYFLTMTKVFDLACQETIIGPGRGSGAGSLVNYLLGITATDPIKYGLLWERFLHRAKAGWPDIDTDAGDRDVLINCSRKLFGEESVVPVSNFNTLKLKSLIKDVAKFFGIDFAEVNRMTGPLQDEVMHQAMGDYEEKSTYVLTHEDCMKYSEKYRKFMDKYPRVRDNVQSLFMESRSIGRHAGGVLICPDLEKYMPLIKVRGELQTPWSEGMNFRHLEPNGFLKFDFLGLSTLKMVEDCIGRIITRDKGRPATFLEIKEFFDNKLNCRYNTQDDMQVWEHVYHKGRFVQVFQFTNTGARKFCLQAKPTSIAELGAITAIYRPGPLAAGVHRKYVKVKSKPDEIVYKNEKIRKILEETFGFIVFQEQFMLLAQDLSGFDKGASDKMRKTLVKKSLDANAAKVKEREDLRKKFVGGAVDLSGMDYDDAVELYETIEAFSAYGFNKSHAVSYAIDSYYSAWLHTYYEKDWLATCLQMLNGSNKFGKVLSEIKELGYNILPVDVNYSTDVWTYSEEKMGFVPPLTSVKGLGDTAVEEIIRNRPYSSLDQMLFNEEGKWYHSKLNKTGFTALCKIEALHSLEEMWNGSVENHRQLMSIIIDNYDKLRKSRWGMSLRKAKKESPPEMLPQLIESTKGMWDWTRIEKLKNYHDLCSETRNDLAFPDELMEKINKSGVKPVLTMEPGEKCIAWFCVVEMIKKTTKNKRTFYRIRITDNLNNTGWIRMWGEAPEDMQEYSIWLTDAYNDPNWGASTSVTKVRPLIV